MSPKPVVSIRALQESDAEAFFQLVQKSRAHLERWLPWVKDHTSVQASRRHISAGIVQQALRNGGQWGVFVGPELAGEVCMHWIQWQHRSASLGYWIGSPFLRQGLALEACSLLLHIAYVEYDLHRLELSIATENTPSLALARKLGFIPEGVQRQSEWILDRYYDHQLLGLLRDEYSDGSYGNHIHRNRDDSEEGKVYY